MRLIAFSPKTSARSAHYYSEGEGLVKLGLLVEARANASAGAGAGVGALTLEGKTGIIDIGARLQEKKWENANSLKHVLQRLALQQESSQEACTVDFLLSFFESYQGSKADYYIDDIHFLPTLYDAEKYICIGVNYQKRNEEYRDGSPAPKKPSVFMRTRESFVGHECPLIIPHESNQLDYEGEIAIVIAKGGRRLQLDKALQHIAGLTLMNEGSVRDWLRHGKFNVTQGKNFSSSGSLGPYLSIQPFNFAKLHIQTKVNNELRQNDTTENLLFSFAYLLCYLSSFFTLKPGDVIATGTPPGTGASLIPAQYLVPGDSVVVHSPEIASLKNPVIHEASAEK